ncbi:MAG: GNAT family N-acetyltransferase [Gammaproteobacteria bacterium]|nr:GNAT family N-acetyltransferase [Gammaproteobacteria bacterium]
MQPVFIDSISKVPREQWNALCGDGGSPFTRHEFLLALEETGCACADTGWQPHHLLLRDSAGQALLGAMPAYIKSHSWGEYVFDWAWADAYRRHGLAYYPKLLCAVPFTPVTGTRLLCAPGAPPAVRDQLLAGTLKEATSLGLSSAHWLFTAETDRPALTAAGLLPRSDHQFHWHNAGYTDFEDFLSALSARKRKNIRRERRRVSEAGITTRVAPAIEMQTADWDRIFDFYRATVARKGAIPYLTREFFSAIARTLPDQVRLALACQGSEIVAVALLLEDRETVYGRYWGCQDYFDGLHFELCYYRPIEYCIATGLARFEAGAQGEHKLSRGLLPQPTSSFHWLSHPGFADAIARHLEHEQAHETAYRDLLSQHTPYRR